MLGSSVFRVSYSDDSVDDFVCPDLIKIQRDSYHLFICGDQEANKKSGLYNTFKSVFPIEDNSGKATLEFVSCKLSDVKYDEQECLKRGFTYSASLRALLRLVVWSHSADNATRTVKNIKEQEVYIVDVPMMTSKGTFIINGFERVVVSQVHRSPGVFIDYNRNKSSDSKISCIAKVVPYRGSWLDFEYTTKGLIFFRIDKKRKLPVIILLRALNLSNADVFSLFYEKVLYERTESGWVVEFVPMHFKGVKLKHDLVNAENNEVLLSTGTYVSEHKARQLHEGGLQKYLLQDVDLEGGYFADDVLDKSEVLFSAAQEVTSEVLQQLQVCSVDHVYIARIDGKLGPCILNSILYNSKVTYEDSLLEMYNVLRPGESPTVESAKTLFNDMFFSPLKYDLSSVGRMKIGVKFGVPWDENNTVLTQEDIILTIKELALVSNGYRPVDDIDNLSNRRVRSVGEFIENQIRVGLVRMQGVIVDHMSSADVDVMMPFDLINSKILMAVLKEFFTSSPLSQFMDQTNPLSEITHKRRLSALGPGGLSRERAGFEVRDVHISHRGRICPIETPEGQNIGLISSLATCARINKYGFIETPYRKVTGGIVTGQVEYLSSIEEDNYNIAQANSVLDAGGKFVEETVYCRSAGDIVPVTRNNVNYMDLTPKQIVSVAASLIPFLENNDANRALMGSNMQRQAVPLLKAEVPLVGTGMEGVIAKGAGALIVAKSDGYVNYVSSSSIIVSSKTEFNVEKYSLRKYERSNDGTLINQKPLVKLGDPVKVGDVIADGVATQNGELALGCNLVVAFMPWKGYNFEDSIVISDRVLEEDMFTSIHLEEFECVVRDTRLGAEEVTRDIPNVGEEFLCNLDEYGIVHIGTEVEEGDVLVGKVTPKSESFVTPEDKLLRAIFGEKAVDVRDTSLYLPPGVSGKVIDVRIFVREGIECDGRMSMINQQQIAEINKSWKLETKAINDYAYGLLERLLLGKSLSNGKTVTKEDLDGMPKTEWWELDLSDNAEVKKLYKKFNDQILNIDQKFKLEITKVESDDAELAQGVLRVIQVFVATKHSLQPGDKMAGRHGNKGVISKIASKEDMPYLSDGTPVDIVLNSLGIPSRMNVGQVLETHLGWACLQLRRKIKELLSQDQFVELRDLLQKIYFKNSDVCKKLYDMSDVDLVSFSSQVSNNLSFSAPVFESPKDEDISCLLDLAGVSPCGQEDLYDGTTGEKFDRKVTVGSIYMLKLHHLVDDKMHARSVGPYSLITQQPLGGKSYFGGQRFGEMECWALQAYGASYILQEMLTIKSDDVVGRVKLYDAIVNNNNNFACGVPESFHVMINELRALCLDIKLYQDDQVVN